MKKIPDSSTVVAAQEVFCYLFAETEILDWMFFLFTDKQKLSHIQVNMFTWVRYRNKTLENFRRTVTDAFFGED